MNAKVFAEQMGVIAGVYRDDGFMSDTVLDAWYRFLQDIPDDVFEATVSVWCRTETKPPTVAELLGECRIDIPQ